MEASLARPGIRHNRAQFFLLVLITAFIGSMVGMERPLIPKLAQEVFGLTSKTAMFSFIVAFGISKALTNFITGRLSDRYGRKRLLVLGWLFALPIPWILMYAGHWQWIIAGNILLGISQGMTWSSTQVMKLDLSADRERVHQVLFNLVDNAVRYTPNGGSVTVSARRRNGSVEVAVSDTGTGIPAEHLPRLFERFYRADPARGRGEGGTGIGLAIARSVVEAHGGQIKAESRPGQGSIFTFDLPAADGSDR